MDIMRIQISLLSLCIALFGYQPISHAFGRMAIDCEAAERGFTVAVPSGIGVDIKVGCGGDVADMQLSDPSRFVARKRGPQHLYIKRISTLTFPGNISSSDGATMLSVVMTNGSLYQFRVVPGGSGGYSLLDVGGQPSFKALPPKLPVVDNTIPTLSVPSVPKVKAEAPLPPAPAIALESSPVPEVPQLQSLPDEKLNPLEAKVKPVQQLKPVKADKPKKKKRRVNVKEQEVALALPPIVFDTVVPLDLSKPVQTPSPPPVAASVSKKPDHVVLLKGLNSARIQKKVVYLSPLWYRTQDAIYVLRTGKSLEVAAKRSGVKLQTLKSLLACTPNQCKISQ